MEFYQNFRIVLIERVVDSLPSKKPFSFKYVSKARARMCLLERIEQAQHNSIHTDGLNDTKDFNNNGCFRRNTPLSFISHHNIYNHIFKSDDTKDDEKEICDIDFEFYGLLHMYNHHIERNAKILIENLRDVEKKYYHNRNYLDNNKYYKFNIKDHVDFIITYRKQLDNNMVNRKKSQKYTYNINYQLQKSVLNDQNNGNVIGDANNNNNSKIDHNQISFDMEWNFENCQLLSPQPPPIPLGTIPPLWSVNSGNLILNGNNNDMFVEKMNINNSSDVINSNLIKDESQNKNNNKNNNKNTNKNKAKRKTRSNLAIDESRMINGDFDNYLLLRGRKIDKRENDS